MTSDSRARAYTDASITYLDGCCVLCLLIDMHFADTMSLCTWSMFHVIIWLRSSEHPYWKIKKICHASRIRFPWLSGNVCDSRRKAELNSSAETMKTNFERYRVLKEDRIEMKIRQDDNSILWWRLKLIWSVQKYGKVRLNEMPKTAELIWAKWNWRKRSELCIIRVGIVCRPLYRHSSRINWSALAPLKTFLIRGHINK